MQYSQLNDCTYCVGMRVQNSSSSLTECQLSRIYRVQAGNVQNCGMALDDVCMEECSISNTASSANPVIAFDHAQRCGSRCLGELCGAQPYLWQVHALVHLRKYLGACKCSYLHCKLYN